MWGHYTYHIQLSPRVANHMNVITLPNLSVRVAPPISHKPFKLIPLVTWVLEMPPNTLHPWVNSALGQQHTKLTWPQSKFYSYRHSWVCPNSLNIMQYYLWIQPGVQPTQNKITGASLRVGPAPELTPQKFTAFIAKYLLHTTCTLLCTAVTRTQC